jgi:hypothetical protein
MSKQRKYCGKQLVKRTWAATTACFESSVDEVLEAFNVDFDLFPRHTIIGDMRSFKLKQLFGHEELHPQIEQIKEEVDRIYLEKLCMLPTKTIEDVIWADDQGKSRRTQRTINTLTSELVRRAIMGDSSQSESNIHDRGVSNVKPTKKSRKSTRRKKRKSSKSRRRN